MLLRNTLTQPTTPCHWILRETIPTLNLLIQFFFGGGGGKKGYPVSFGQFFVPREHNNTKKTQLQFFKPFN